MRKILLHTIVLVLFCISGYAQDDKFWIESRRNSFEIAIDKGAARETFPKEFKLFDLDQSTFRQQLFSVIGTGKRTTLISLPNTVGAVEQFEVVEASNFEPALQAQFPEIRAFSGKGITDPSATLKISISPQGIQAMIFRSETDNEFIEPYSNDHKTYAVFKSQRQKGIHPWSCTTPEGQLAIDLDKTIGRSQLAGRSGANLKIMRLAQSVTAEYSNYFGATSASQVNLVLAAVNNTLTRCNGVYEKDLALHLNLVSNTTAVFYYSASTDPYSAASTGAGGAWNTELQNTLTSVIGEANYDIGHLFGASGGGGNAGCIGCVCVNGQKGKGFTSPADGIPQGDNFDIDYVVHEVGHQLGGNHTFSMNNEGTGVNKEPGSGITIMGYAGITSQDLAPHSFDFYHQATIAQIQTNLNSKTCPTTLGITNSTPVVNTVANYTIPKSTPFALTGAATDSDAGNVLTYCWEQNDNASNSQTGANSVASATKASGPNWISLRPTTSPTRYFPQLSTILAGGTVTGPQPGGDAGANTEALSSVARTLNFRLTVRDNAVYSSTAPVSVGQTQFTDMVVTVNSTAGPFAVSAPNTAVSWAGGSSQTVTWSVNSTNLSTINCASVKISLSTDGGQTFPTVLSASTANDGSEIVTIPNVASATARIKVEAIGNIFFDISNTNFSITAGSGCTAPSGLAASSITTSAATVSWSAVSGAISYDVDYKTNAASTWTNAVSGTTATSVNITALSSATLYDWRVRTNCSGSSSAYTSAQFTSAAPATCNAPGGLSAAAITTSSATISWVAVSGAASYSVDYKTNASATWINAATATTSTSVNLSGLTAATLYDWRVRTNCASGSSSYTSAQFTTGTTSGCATAFEPNETLAAALAITSGVTNSAAISSATDIDYYKITTTAVSSITYNLVGPSGVDYDLYIYNSAGTQIGSGTSGTATETISLANQAAGTYYIKVIGYNGANSTTCYTIKATVTTATGCQSSYDNSTNGTISGAATIPFNTDVTGLINVSGDIDNYKFVITTAGTITLTLGTLPADYDLKLLNSAGTQVGISQNGSTTSETINYTATAGTYYAQVYGYSNANNASSCYTLKVQLGTATRNEQVSKDPVVTLYPNPVHSALKIDMGGYAEVVNVAVIDMYGRKTLQSSIAGSGMINTERMMTGVYIVVITAADGKILKQQKIVKE